MKVICHLTDREILGTEGLSSKKPRSVSTLVAKKPNLFFLPTCAGEKTLLSLPVCERSDQRPQARCT